MDTVDSINREYSARCNGRLKVSLRSTYPYAYKATLLRDKVEIQAATPLLASHAMARVGTGILSGHLSEYLGDVQPIRSLRPIWYQTEELLPEGWEERLIKLGFNALITSQPPKQPTSVQVFTTEVSELANSSGLFWKSEIDQPDYLEGKDDFTTFDVLKMELKNLESLVPPDKTLLFYVPTDNPELLKRLTLFQKQRTVLLFQNEKYHPLWKSLRSHMEVIPTPLMPIDSFEGGENWPTIPLDRYTQTIDSMRRHHFIGAVAVSKVIPEIESLRGLRLWLAAEMQWTRRSLRDLFETWVRAYQPAWRADSLFDLFEKASQIERNILIMRSSPNQNHLFLETKARIENLELASAHLGGEAASLFQKFIKEVR